MDLEASRISLYDIFSGYLNYSKHLVCIACATSCFYYISAIASPVEIPRLVPLYLITIRLYTFSKFILVHIYVYQDVIFLYIFNKFSKNIDMEVLPRGEIVSI